MIAIRAAAIFATLAVHGAAAQNHINGSSDVRDAGIGLRGNKQEQQQDETRRDLVTVNMDIGAGDMVCNERVPYDGTVVCTFRTLPPSLQRDLPRIHHDCLHRKSSGSDVCLTAEVSEEFFPGETPSPTPVAPQGQPPQHLHGAHRGECPDTPQRSGTSCYDSIPLGKTETTCVYGSTRCDCDMSSGDAWSCKPIHHSPPTPQPVRFEAIVVTHEGECPDVPQTSGMPCHDAIPFGATETTCFYGTNQCDCTRSNENAWSCKPIQNSPPTWQPLSDPEAGPPFPGQGVEDNMHQDLGLVGVCPDTPQTSGKPCSQYIPFGATETTCFYGLSQCDCDTTVGVTWICHAIQNALPTRQPSHKSEKSIRNSHPTRRQTRSVKSTKPESSSAD